MIITRDFEHILAQRLKEKLNLLQVVLGPRQVGKTTAVSRIFDGWPGPKHFATADDLIPLDVRWLERQWLTARAMGPGVLLVIDEIQKITGWSDAVKKLFDEVRSKYTMKVVLLGSASLALTRGLADSLTGRFEIIDAQHWSFHEVLKLKKLALKDYLLFGGYPAALEFVSDLARWAKFMKGSIIEPVLSRDIQSVADIRKPALFRQTFELAMHYPAQEISLNKLLGQLQDKGNITTIKYYLELLQGAFLLKTLGKFSTRALSTKASSPKLLPLDNGLVGAYAANFYGNATIEPDWLGRLLEMAIGAELSKSEELFYWREDNDEVDFVFRRQGRIWAVEVKSGRRRLGKGLDRFVSTHKNVVPVVLDWDKAERFLSAEGPMLELEKIAGVREIN